MTVAKFCKLFYIFQFFFDFILIYAIDKLFFLDRGMELYQIAILLVVWELAAMPLEIPSGALADRWSRKNMLVLAGIIYALCYATWFFSHSFWLFALGFVFKGAGGAFVSGTLEAYVFDFLKTHKSEDLFEKIWGMGKALRLGGIAVALILGGILSSYSLELTLILSALSPLFVSLIALRFPQVNPTRSTGEVKYLYFLKESIKQTLSKPLLLKFFIYSSVILATFGVMDEYSQVILDWLGQPAYLIGIWLSGGFIVAGVASYFAYRFRDLGWGALHVTAILSVILLFSIAFFRSPLLIIAILLLYFLGGFAEVHIQGLLQREIESKNRATVTSLSTFLFGIISIVTGLAFGFISQKLGINVGYGFFAAILAASVIGYFVFTAIKIRIANRSIEQEFTELDLEL